MTWPDVSGHIILGLNMLIVSQPCSSYPVAYSWHSSTRHLLVYVCVEKGLPWGVYTVWHWNWKYTLVYEMFVSIQVGTQQNGTWTSIPIYKCTLESGLESTTWQNGGYHHFTTCCIYMHHGQNCLYDTWVVKRQELLQCSVCGLALYFIVMIIEIDSNYNYYWFRNWQYSMQWKSSSN